MKKVLLIEDRFQRQALFDRETNIDLADYGSVLDNFTNGKENNLFELTIREEFDYAQYDYILCHKSIFNGDNSQFLMLLHQCTQKSNTPLVLFSGGVSVNYYSSNPYEVLELNSKIFYSQNLKLFLDAVEKEDENILMLCYGQNWKLNILSNTLEKINLFINENFDNDRIVYNNFINKIEIAKIETIDYNFYDVVVDNGWISIEEIIRFKDSIFKYFQDDGNNSSILKKEQKTLLIHNFNVDLNLFNSQIIFNIRDMQIDNYISTDIVEKINKKEFDTIFIKDNLSSNYFELYGLVMAYHIRLSTKLSKQTKYLPIVIISDFDSKILNQFNQMARILFTKNIFIIKNTKEAIEEFSNRSIKPLTEEAYKTQFLDLIEIEAPRESSHDIANEWAIYQWAEFLKVEDDAIKANRDKIDSMLYFKYLLALNPIEKQKAIGYKRPKLSGKVLYIDDEWSKGWSSIFNNYFPDNIKFETLKKDFKNANIFSLQAEIKNKIINNIPDVVLLDLRLVEKDHTREEIENLTGIKITQMIKEINPAIQVIIFTATNKSRILEELYKHKILGYIKKAHPEDKNLSTKNSFAKLAELVDIGLEKKYLKEIWEIQKKLLALDLSNNISIEIKSIFEILDSEMENRFIYAMFAIFKCIEIINNYYFIDGYKKATWRDTKVEIVDNSSKNKILLILDKKLQLRNNVICQNIEDIIKIRNNTIHPSDRNIVKPIKENILTWFNMLLTILEKIDETSR